MLTPESSLIIVEVSAKPALAKVVRAGYNVPAPSVNRTEMGFVIDQLVPVTAQQQPRVIQQSVPVGTRVMAGTVIDLTLAPREDIPFQILSDIHPSFEGKPVAEVDKYLADPKVREAVLKYDTPDAVPPEMRKEIEAKLKGMGVDIDDTDPAKTLDSAFLTVRGAAAFL